MTPTPTLAWAIKAPDGNLLEVDIDENCAIDKYCSCRPFFLDGAAAYWNSKYNAGYRCVRVQIQEVQE